MSMWLKLDQSSSQEQQHEHAAVSPRLFGYGKSRPRECENFQVSADDVQSDSRL